MDVNFRSLVSVVDPAALAVYAEDSHPRVRVVPIAGERRLVEIEAEECAHLLAFLVDALLMTRAEADAAIEAV